MQNKWVWSIYLIIFIQFPFSFSLFHLALQTPFATDFVQYPVQFIFDLGRNSTMAKYERFFKIGYSNLQINPILKIFFFIFKIDVFCQLSHHACNFSSINADKKYVFFFQKKKKKWIQLQNKTFFFFASLCIDGVPCKVLQFACICMF